MSRSAGVIAAGSRRKSLFPSKDRTPHRLLLRFSKVRSLPGALAWSMLHPGIANGMIARKDERAAMRRPAVHSAMKRAMLGATLVLVTGCGGANVLMPPRFDLQAFRKIGLVEFTSNAEGDLQALASQEFIQNLQSSQPGVPVLELGDEELVLAAIGRDKFDPAAIQAMGKVYNVDAVIIGSLEVTDVKPKVDLTQVLTSASVQADVEAALTTRLLEAGSGATVWTRSARSKQTVANAGLDSHGGIHFEARDPETAYGSLVHNLVHHVTQDFRPYWVKQ